MDGKRRTVLLVMASLLFCVSPGSSMQGELKLVTNYPNPFDSRSSYTTIAYRLVADATVKITIYDLLGNRVRVFPSSFEVAGLRQQVWDGTDDGHRKVAKGGYVCVVEIDNEAARYTALHKIGVIR